MLSMRPASESVSLSVRVSNPLSVEVTVEALHLLIRLEPTDQQSKTDLVKPQLLDVSLDPKQSLEVARFEAAAAATAAQSIH